MSNENKGLAWKGEWHTAVPDSLLHSSMSSMAKLLWICLKSFASKDSPKPFPGRHTLMKMCSIGKNSFNKYRQELEHCGWLQTEQRRDQTGGWMSNICTLCIPVENVDNSDNRFPNHGKPVSGKPNCGKPQIGKHKETQDLEGIPGKKENHHQRAADAASGGAPASQASLNGNGKIGPEELAKCFLDLWSQDFKVWFGVKYRVRDQDVTSAEELFQDYQEEKARPLDLLFIARKMWLATQEWDDPKEDKADPWFYNIKAQRSAGFFCRYFDKIVKEQGETVENVVHRISQKEADDLEHLIKAGREEAASI